LNSTANVARAEHRTSLRVQAAGEFSAVRSAVAQIDAWLAELGITEADRGAWELTLMEAGNNAVKYSDPEARRQPILFELSAGARDIEARVTDHTAGFDWPAEVALPAPDAEHGRGLYLMQSLTDEIFYLRNPRQNVLVMRRLRHTGDNVLPDPGDLQRRLAQAESALTEMTAELAASYESLVAVFRYSSELGGHANLTDFSNRLLRDLMPIAEADILVLRLLAPDGKRLETALVLPDPGVAKLAPIALADESAKSAETRAARSRMDIWFSPEEALDPHDPLRAAISVGNGICHAFFVADQLVGTAVLGRLAANKPFTAAQVNLLHTFVDFLAIQIVNARLLDERTAARVTRRELEIAADIQRSLLPAQLPACPPFSLAASCQSALQIGGDFYDVIPAGEGAVLLIIADVMGKGVPAALFAAVLRSTVRSMSQLFAQPGELLSATNRTLFPDLSRVNMFITATLVYVDSHRGGMISACAGHCPLLFWGPGAGGNLPSQAGFPLGIEAETSYRQTVSPLPPGTAALLYTDGLSEARNTAGEQFGETRLQQAFAEAAAQTHDAEAAKAVLLRRLADFRGQAALTDDQTLILIRHLS
jgi:serine phosphatase RsbU (regulator of sigma subunit)/anti-sigma regulatory factor (Ser/Thr protein kinase)